MLTNKQEITFFSVLGAILMAFLVIIYLYGHPGREKDLSRFEPGVPGTLEVPALAAEAAFVYDVASDTVLYAKNPDKRLPLASVTKVMAALVAKELAPEQSTVTVSREAVRTTGDSGLFLGERWLLKDLLDFTLVSSANDGATAMALALGALGSSTANDEEIINDFVAQMNRKAAELGMKDTYYFNDTGLDESEVKGGAYGSARDQAMLFAHILRERPFLLSATGEPSITAVSLDGIVHVASNTSSIVGEIPGIIASKTGYTDLAGGNLVVAFDPEIGRPIVVAVLGSTLEGRFEDVLELINASLESVQNSVVLD